MHKEAAGQDIALAAFGNLFDTLLNKRKVKSCVLGEFAVGPIFLSRGRYYWRGVLPGETQRQSISIKSKGVQYPLKIHYFILEWLIKQEQSRDAKSPF
jgi:hypothetical protein